MPPVQRAPHDQKNTALVPMPLKNGWALDRDGRRLIAICQVYHVFPKQGSSHSSGDRFLTIWDLETGNVQAVSAGRRGMECLTLDPAGKVVATGESDGISLWNVETLERRQSLRNPITTPRVLEGWSTRGRSGEGPFEYTFKVLAVRFSPDGRRLFAASASGRVDVYDVVTGKSLGSLEGHNGRVLSLALSPDGGMLASGGEDRVVRLWDTAGGKEFVRWEAHDEGVTALAFSADGRTLASGGDDGKVLLWDLPFLRRELKTLGLDW
jgi:WD40 repeat protein